MAKGVATLMDTVFLLLISGVAAAILFYAGANYGKTLSSEASSLLMDYYARQAIRTMSSATVHIPGCAPDYLLAYLKEHAYYNDLGSEDVKNAIGSVLADVMRPVGPAFDYAVAIMLGSGNDSPVYVYVWQHDRTGLKSKVCGLTMGGYQKWLSESFAHLRTYSYSVPVRFKLNVGGSDEYTVGRIQLLFWPSGARVNTPC